MSAITPAETSAVSQGAKASVAAREYLSFRLGTEEYGIDILRVQEIRGYEQPTRLVGAPEFIRGVLNLRGVIVPIVDLRVRFGIDAGFDTFTVTDGITEAKPMRWISGLRPSTSAMLWKRSTSRPICSFLSSRKLYGS